MSPGLTSARFDTRSIASGGSLSTPTTMPPGARPLGQRAGRGVAVDEQLHARRVRRRRPDDAADEPGRRDHRHVGLDAVSRAAADGHRPHARIRVAGDHSAASVGSGVVVCRSSSSCSRADRAASARCSCSRTSSSATCLLQRLVLRPHAAQPDVIAPDVADAVERPRSSPPARAQTPRTSPPGAPARPTSTAPAPKSGSAVPR